MSPLSKAGVTGELPHPLGMSMGSEDAKSSPYNCAASALATAISLQSINYYIIKCSLIYCAINIIHRLTITPERFVLVTRVKLVYYLVTYRLNVFRF